MLNRGPKFLRALEGESGYSLVEVMVAIMLLALAIIPMVSMFDTALRATTQGSSYDTARAFANAKLEQAKGLSYAQVRDNFPRTGDTTPSSSAFISTNPHVPSNFPTVPSDFRYFVSKRYLTPPPVGTTSTSATLTPGGTTDTGIIELTVTVRWGSNTSYGTSGVVSKGTL